MADETSTGGSSSAPRGRGRVASIPPQALRRSLLQSMSSAGTSDAPVPRGRGRGRKGGRGGRAGGGRGRGRQTAAPSLPPPPADSPEHRVEASSEAMETPVHQPPPVVEEKTTSEQAAWSPSPEVQAPEGEDGGEERWRDAGSDEAGDEAEVGEGDLSSTVYQHGGTRLPIEPVTLAHKALITPDGES